MMLRCELTAKIREIGKENDVTVVCAVSVADGVQAKRYRDTMIIGEIDKKERGILEVFGVPTPKEEKTGQYVFGAALIICCKGVRKGLLTRSELKYRRKRMNMYKRFQIKFIQKAHTSRQLQ